MKKSFFIALLFLLGNTLFSQPQSPFINSNINFEVGFLKVSSHADGDDWIFSGVDEITVLFQLYGSSIGAFQQLCAYHEDNVPFVYDLPSGFFNAAYDVPFTEALSVNLTGFESDATNGEICTYHDYDDIYSSVLTNLWSGGSYVVSHAHPVTPGTWDERCGPGGNAYIISPGNAINYDATMRKLWRYTNGDDFDHALDFGVLNIGQDREATEYNRSATGGIQSGLPLGWTDNGGQPSPDVFQAFSLIQTAEVTISTDNDARNFDTILELYDASGNLLTSDDDSGIEGDGRGSIIKTVLNAGTYKIKIEGYENEQGDFRTTLKARISNDEACNSILIPVDGVAHNGFSNQSATSALGETDIAPADNDCVNSWCNGEEEPRIKHSVWFRFVAPASGSVEVSTCGNATFDTQLAVYATTDCNNFSTYTLLKANDDGNGCAGYSSELEVSGLNPGQTYQVLLDGYNAWQGDFGIKITSLSASAVNTIATTEVLTASPNPTTDVLHLQMSSTYNLDAYSLSDLTGRTLMTEHYGQSQQEVNIDLSVLPKGVYLLQVKAGAQWFSQKVVLQ